MKFWEKSGRILAELSILPPRTKKEALGDAGAGLMVVILTALESNLIPANPYAILTQLFLGSLIMARGYRGGHIFDQLPRG